LRLSHPDIKFLTSHAKTQKHKLETLLRTCFKWFRDESANTSN